MKKLVEVTAAIGEGARKDAKGGGRGNAEGSGGEDVDGSDGQRTFAGWV